MFASTEGNWTMNWRLAGTCSLTGGEDGTFMPAGLKVRLLAGSLHQFCIGLCLLDKGLVESLDLVESDSDRVLRLTAGARSTSVQSIKNKIVLSLDGTELERWVHFTLRTVRDGVAEVDHLDVDARVEGGEAEATTIVVVFPGSGSSGR
ncbi:hypothetical protein [Roseateles sp. L2-2]|uniref:hypothetical protein n=1 Tax=Roseateles sp. L2-2 TaxID=3422597 RepID=UPI003D367E4E